MRADFEDYEYWGNLLRIPMRGYEFSFSSINCPLARVTNPHEGL